LDLYLGVFSFGKSLFTYFSSKIYGEFFYLNKENLGRNKKGILKIMSLNFEGSYLEYDSDDIPFSLYEIHGLNKIKELSRQLRTYINFKTATMQYRFRPKNITGLNGVDEKCHETKKNLKQNASKFIKLLFKIKGNPSRILKILIILAQKNLIK